MSHYREALRHPLDHPVATVCTVAFGMAGQLLLTRALTRAAEFAEQEESQPTIHAVPGGRGSARTVSAVPS